MGHQTLVFPNSRPLPHLPSRQHCPTAAAAAAAAGLQQPLLHSCCRRRLRLLLMLLVVLSAAPCLLQWLLPSQHPHHLQQQKYATHAFVG
jgi:hypothetical protein